MRTLRTNAHELVVVPHHDPDSDIEVELLRGLLKRQRLKEEGPGRVTAEAQCKGDSTRKDEGALRPQINNSIDIPQED